MSAPPRPGRRRSRVPSPAAAAPTSRPPRPRSGSAADARRLPGTLEHTFGRRRSRSSPSGSSSSAGARRTCSTRSASAGRHAVVPLRRGRRRRAAVGRRVLRPGDYHAARHRRRPAAGAIAALAPDVILAPYEGFDEARVREPDRDRADRGLPRRALDDPVARADHDDRRGPRQGGRGRAAGRRHRRLGPGSPPSTPSSRASTSPTRAWAPRRSTSTCPPTRGCS